MAKMSRDDVKNLFTEAQGKKQGGGDFPDFPAGRYRGKLTKCEYYETKSGKRYIRHFWTILDGKFAGQVAQDYRRCENAVGIGITLSEWEKLGVATDSVSDFDTLADVAEKVNSLGAVCTFRIAESKANPKFKNYYIDDVEDFEGGEAEAGGEAGEPDEDGGSEGDSIDVGDMVEFEYEGKKVVKPIVAVDEDEGAVVVKINGEKVSIPVADVLRKVE